MPDAPSSLTPFLSLGLWDDGANPGADALNGNWGLLDTAFQGIQTLLEGLDLSGKADQSDLDALSAALDALEAEIAAAAYVKADGSVPMTGALDMGTHKIAGLSNGDNPDEAINRGQLDAAIAAGLGALSGSYAYVLARNTGDVSGSSPVTFAADQNDGTTSEPDLHDVGVPSHFVATQTGFYLLTARLRVADAGGALPKWMVNGVEAPACVQPPIVNDAGTGEAFLVDTLMLKLTAADVVTLLVYGLESEPVVIKAGSTVAMFLLAANAVGGGDLKSDGSVPMVDPFDNGGFRQTNAGDALDPTDLVTLQQLDAVEAALEAEIAGISAGQMVAPEAEMTGGDQAFSGTGWTDVTGSAIVFTLAAPRPVAMDAQATALPDFLNRSNAQIGLKVQRTGDAADVYPGTFVYTGPYGYLNHGTIAATKKKTLAAGEWTVSMVVRQLSALGASTSVSKSASAPARVGAVYTA